MSHLNMSTNLKQIAQSVELLRGNRSALLFEAKRLRTCVGTITESCPKRGAGGFTPTELPPWAESVIDVIETAAANIDSILNRQREDG